MNELDQFRQWAEQIGHWRIVEAIDRWRKLTTPPADGAKESLAAADRRLIASGRASYDLGVLEGGRLTEELIRKVLADNTLDYGDIGLAVEKLFKKENQDD